MAEFDSGGLSAVSAFFGLDKKKNDEAPSSLDASRSQDVSRRGRQGVGSVAKQVKLSAASDSTIGRVLNVGKRKRQADDDDDGSDSAHESDVEDDEEGRTSLAATAKPTVSISDNAPQKVKKKKGKKERQANKLEMDAQQNEQGATETRHGDTTTTPTEQDLEKSKQRKRRKIRSRQKNIYKDKRLTQHKPTHLILGRAEFAGRPLTAETRAKLNLAPSRSSRSQEHEDDVETLENPMNDSTGNSEGVKLAVDDLLDEGEVYGDQTDTSGVIEQKPLVKNKTKKKKKSKYKNLQL